MAFTTDIDTTGLEQISRPVPRAMPPLDLQPAKSPFLISSLPTTAVVNPDSIKNFNTPGIPQYRFTPPPPISASSGASNTIASVKTLPILSQPTPAPTIASPLVTIPTGYQFSFLQVRLPLSSTLAISSYKIYRNTANNSASASVIQSVIHHQANLGVPVLIQDNQPNGVTQFYWVSAVNTSGQESNLVAAQSGPVTSNAIANSNSQLASSFHGVPNNTSIAPQQTSVLTNNGAVNAITVLPSLFTAGPGTVAYNSGTAFPAFTSSTFTVFASDPTFAGGPVIYQFSESLSAFNQVSSDSFVNFGQIKTAAGTATSGGGNQGGTTGLSAVGGRGYLPQL
jgi:hypothetical protein